MIRLARQVELRLLQDMDVATGRMFETVGMGEIANDPPPALNQLRHAMRQGRLWVMAGPLNRPMAFLMASWVDGCAFVEQVTVHPLHARQGYGAALIRHLADFADSKGARAVLLTTFRDVPWNAPYYARLGFEAMADDELGPGLRAIRAAEAARGLDRWPRVAMRLPL